MPFSMCGFSQLRLFRLVRALALAHKQRPVKESLTRAIVRALNFIKLHSLWPDTCLTLIFQPFFLPSHLSSSLCLDGVEQHNLLRCIASSCMIAPYVADAMSPMSPRLSTCALSTHCTRRYHCIAVRRVSSFSSRGRKYFYENE